MGEITENVVQEKKPPRKSTTLISYSREGGNKQVGGAKGVKPINMEEGINLNRVQKTK